MLLLHVRMLVPEDWMLAGLRMHDIPAGVATASAIVPVKPLCGATVIVADTDVPLSKLREATLGVRVTSGVLVLCGVTVTSSVAVRIIEP